MGLNLVHYGLNLVCSGLNLGLLWRSLHLRSALHGAIEEQVDFSAWTVTCTRQAPTMPPDSQAKPTTLRFSGILLDHYCCCGNRPELNPQARLKTVTAASPKGCDLTSFPTPFSPMCPRFRPRFCPRKATQKGPPFPHPFLAVSTPLFGLLLAPVTRLIGHRLHCPIIRSVMDLILKRDGFET